MELGSSSQARGEDTRSGGGETNDEAYQLYPPLVRLFEGLGLVGATSLDQLSRWGNKKASALYVLYALPGGCVMTTAFKVALCEEK